MPETEGSMPPPSPDTATTNPRPFDSRLHEVSNKVGEAPPPGEGPSYNGCQYCPTDGKGNLVTGDVGDAPSRWHTGTYYHWKIDRVEPRGIRTGPVKENPVVTCFGPDPDRNWPGDKVVKGEDIERGTLNVTESGFDVGGTLGLSNEKGSGELSGSYHRSTSTEESKTVTASMSVDCGAYDIPVGQVVNVYPTYRVTEWWGHWEQVTCGVAVGCRVRSVGPTEHGFYYSLGGGGLPVLEPAA
ncbi:hypothetical protein [Nocardia otitidiscaviarum]|uniref:hypothetical protein n=1 Tax=Nocardia otitidiscaviarum TaxID=1823 RepID=UPI0011C053CC|nr:hypothetical protein [Nocardia otitidiscaviarum]